MVSVEVLLHDQSCTVTYSVVGALRKFVSQTAAGSVAHLNKARSNISTSLHRASSNVYFSNMFLAVQNSSIGDLVPWSVCWSGTTNNQGLQNITE